MRMVEPTLDRRLLAAIGRDLQRDLAVSDQFLARQKDPRRAAFAEDLVEPEPLEAIAGRRQAGRRGGHPRGLTEHLVVAELREERVTPGIVAVAEPLGVGPLAPLFEEAILLINQAYDPLPSRPERGEPFEVLGHDGSVAAPE